MMFVQRNHIRYAWTEDGRELRQIGPLSPEDLPPPCPACRLAFQPGEYCTLIVLGPGAYEEERQRCREGRVYNPVVLRVHWACATGETARPPAADARGGASP